MRLEFISPQGNTNTIHYKTNREGSTMSSINPSIMLGISLRPGPVGPPKLLKIFFLQKPLTKLPVMFRHELSGRFEQNNKISVNTRL